MLNDLSQQMQGLEDRKKEWQGSGAGYVNRLRTGGEDIKQTKGPRQYQMGNWWETQEPNISVPEQVQSYNIDPNQVNVVDQDITTEGLIGTGDNEIKLTGTPGSKFPSKGKTFLQQLKERAKNSNIDALSLAASAAQMLPAIKAMKDTPDYMSPAGRVGKTKASLNQRSSMQNISNAMAVDEFNAGADAATKDRKLEALSAMTSNIAGMNRDRLMYKAENVKTTAISGDTGVAHRLNLRLQAAKSAGATSGPEFETAYQALLQQSGLAMYGGIRNLKRKK
jgi:hypothetical protein